MQQLNGDLADVTGMLGDEQVYDLAAEILDLRRTGIEPNYFDLALQPLLPYCGGSTLRRKQIRAKYASEIGIRLESR